MALTELSLLISESKVIIIITLLVVLFTAVIIMAIMCEYRYYQTDHKEKQYNFASFIKQVQFYLLGCSVRCSEKQMLKSPVKLLI